MQDAMEIIREIAATIYGDETVFINRDGETTGRAQGNFCLSVQCLQDNAWQCLAEELSDFLDGKYDISPNGITAPRGKKEGKDET